MGEVWISVGVIAPICIRAGLLPVMDGKPDARVSEERYVCRYVRNTNHMGVGGLATVETSYLCALCVPTPNVFRWPQCMQHRRGINEHVAQQSVCAPCSLEL
mmetsp:Transcript_4731/g.10206  ORF Transcript_4731/g.10206 Transcript_4731/m.10206 type:complete len:102 (+) Transcript_4731:281-586(+)